MLFSLTKTAAEEELAMIDHIYLFVPPQKLVAEFLKTFVDYPPRHKAASFSIDQVLEKLSQYGGSH